MKKILFIDNFDSFTYNLVDEFEKRNSEVIVFRNNIDLNMLDKEIKSFKPHLLVISPGPRYPRDAGNCIQIIQKYSGKIPILGICLGHQCLIEASEGHIDICIETIHGKPSKIKHDDQGIFKGVENPFQAGRYHSLAAKEVPYCFEISARTEDKGVIMAIRHKEHKIFGVQFHPESILTPTGGKIIDNILKVI